MRQIRRVLYKLKRRFGKPIHYVRIINPGTVNLDTGKRDIEQLDSTFIRKVVVLPKRMQEKFVYDLAFISANRNFTEGGFFDRVDCVFLIDARDLKVRVDTTNDYIIWSNERYNVLDYWKVEEEEAYAFTTRRVAGEQTHRVIDGAVQDTFDVTEAQNDDL